MVSKKGRSSNLSVAEKFDSSLTLLLEQKGSHTISVSAVCRNAGVNRSSIYAHHPELIAKVNQGSRKNILTSSDGNESAKKEDSAIQLRDLKRKYQALLTVCIELEAEIIALRKRAEFKKKN